MMSGEKKNKGNQRTLGEEAEILFPIVTLFQDLYNRSYIKDYDYVGIFVLLYLSIRKPNGWSNGKLKIPIVETPTFDSITLEQYELDKHFGCEYIAKKLKISPEKVKLLTVMDLLNTLQLVGVKNNTDHYVNRTIVLWSQGSRPFLLLHHIPTPMEVLRQQARGERVVTLFNTKEDLSKPHTSKLTYMSGMQEHDRDPLEFLIHDLKHMEHYTDPETHYEQVGFFRSVLNLNDGHVKSFFISILGMEISLWYEMEYVISDMNCYSTHLLRYVYAKLSIACGQRFRSPRERESVQESKLQESLPVESEDSPSITESIDDFSNQEHLLFEESWLKILHGFGMQSEPTCTCQSSICIPCASFQAYQASKEFIAINKKIRKELSVEEWDQIRHFFRLQGGLVLGKK